MSAKLPGNDKVEDGVKARSAALLPCEKEAKEAVEKAHIDSTTTTPTPPPKPATGTGSAPVHAENMSVVKAMTANLGYATVISTLRPLAVATGAPPTTANDTVTSAAGPSETPASSKATTTENWGPGFNGCPHPDPTTAYTPTRNRVDSVHDMDDDVYTDDEDSDDSDDEDGDDEDGDDGDDGKRCCSRERSRNQASKVEKWLYYVSC
ncbi:hypothetical protein EKO04_011624 [Ascochyta lentis]|uniref:Uncharacterized protein n=1 Tax=Ascochyta lentis TaxID=205686 RepID=A0A8H7ISY5_9PLEO|nr:hypothetical protein EKO04_011624 [Ascochyta lentis]